MSDPTSATAHAELLDALRQRRALIGVVGLGYVGLPLCLTYAENGYRVLGLDIDESKITAITAGQSYIQHIDAARIHQARSQGRLDVTTDFADVNKIIDVQKMFGRQKKVDVRTFFGISTITSKKFLTSRTFLTSKKNLKSIKKIFDVLID